MATRSHRLSSRDIRDAFAGFKSAAAELSFDVRLWELQEGSERFGRAWRLVNVREFEERLGYSLRESIIILRTLTQALYAVSKRKNERLHASANRN